jgi:hypothetical protein
MNKHTVFGFGRDNLEVRFISATAGLWETNDARSPWLRYARSHQLVGSLPSVLEIFIVSQF